MAKKKMNQILMTKHHSKNNTDVFKENMTKSQNLYYFYLTQKIEYL